MGNRALLPFSHRLNILLWELSGRSAEVCIMSSPRLPEFPPSAPCTEINKIANAKRISAFNIYCINESF